MVKFRKAERSKAKLRLGIFGPSGSGKTFSALRIATGMGGKIVVIDTERSADLYASKFDYDVAELNSPYEPQKYINYMSEAEKAGYDIIIIDSLSHAWEGEGGLLEYHDKITRQSRSQNSYMAWNQVTPIQRKLVNEILKSKIHIIVCLRAKTTYEIQTDDTGKKTPVKIGLTPVFRVGIDYEFTSILSLSIDGHIASCDKDRTQLFDGKLFKPSEQTGKDLTEWLNIGKDNTQSEQTDKMTDSQRKFLFAKMNDSGLSSSEQKSFFHWALGENERTKNWASFFIDNYDRFFTDWIESQYKQP